MTEPQPLTAEEIAELVSSAREFLERYGDVWDSYSVRHRANLRWADTVEQYREAAVSLRSALEELYHGWHRNWLGNSVSDLLRDTAWIEAKPDAPAG